MPIRKKRYANMEKYNQTRRKQKKRYYARTAGIYPIRRWTDEENKMVIDHLQPDSQLSAIIKRSVASIQTQRNKLKQKK